MATAIERISEFFLLRDLERRARDVPAEVRETVARAHVRAKQKRDAAEALWIAGCPAEALRLAREAVDVLRTVDDAARAEVEPVALPELDEDVLPEHGDRFRALVDEADRLLGAQAARALDTKAVARARTNRIATAVSVVLAVLALSWIVLRTPRVLKAEASAQWDGRYDAAKAVDGSDRTDWLLPDKATGWLDVQVVPARKVSKLKVMNARNVPYNDRATHEFHVDAYRNGQVVRSFDAKFDGFSPDPAWRTFDVGEKVEKFRLTVKSHHKSGGGFSEIEVE